jgi:CubicO group peptidase (beta-lactamase class C family)
MLRGARQATTYRGAFGLSRGLDTVVEVQIMKRNIIVLAFILFSSGFANSRVPSKEKVVAGAERAFEKAAKNITMPAPGCSVGVSLNGESVFEKAFGLAEMEHNIPNTPWTIFESGSVAKQFTAAALVLLKLDGKLSLDDPVRKYIPELPDYGAPMTIRHLLNHTAGLRDYLMVGLTVGGWRGDRFIRRDMVFDLITRQKALDFTPGAEYSYSNSGYQLAVAIVERVSQQKFPDFVAERLFKPLGMTHSSWRDDYRRLVPGRAQAYSRQGQNGPWQLNMPFRNDYEAGGMLTTVGDWLKWNAMLDSRSLGAPLVEALETRGVLNDGRKISYALGLGVRNYKGIKEVSQGGLIAGYSTFLIRFPERKLSVAVLCNDPSSSRNVGYSIVDEVLGPFPEAPKQPEALRLSDEQLKKFIGLWRDEKTHNANRIVFENDGLRLNGTALRPMADGSFMLDNSRISFAGDKDGKPTAAEINNDGEITRLTLQPEWTPTAAELASFAGDWYSEEADAKFTFAVEDGKAFLIRRPATRFPLTPLYRDHFSAQAGSLAEWIVWFTRNLRGGVDKLHIGARGMRDMPFERVKK